MLIVNGANGSGKTTLLTILSGLTLPSMGFVYWNDKNIHELISPSHLHFIGHCNGLKPQLTVLEQLTLILLMHRKKRSLNVQSTLEQFALQTFVNTPIAKLSEGQRRRVALTKLTLIEKPLWILDEPLNALDMGSQIFIQDMINQHRDNGGIVIASSHHEMNDLSKSILKLTL